MLAAVLRDLISPMPYIYMYIYIYVHIYYILMLMSASTAGYRAQLLGDAALTAGMADSNTFQNADTLE